MAGKCQDLGNDPTIIAVNVEDLEFPGGFVSGGQVAGGSLVDLSDIAHLGAGGLSLMPLYLPTIEGKAPSFTARISMASLTVKYLPPGGSSLQLGAGSALTMGSGSSARSSEVSISAVPAAVTLLTVPPRMLKVNEPFLVKARVTISSGAPLAGANVLMKTVPTSGPTETPLAFLGQVVGPQTVPMGEFSPPMLLNSSVEAVTDSAGVARFVLTFGSGPPVSQVSLVAKAGKVSSPRSDAIVITNDVAEVNASNITYIRTGAQGIGAVDTESVRLRGEKPETFPIVLDLPDEMTMSVRLRPSAIPADGNVSFLRRVVEFNIFSQADMDKLAEQKKKIDELAAKVANCTDVACSLENVLQVSTSTLGATMANGRRLQSMATLNNVQSLANYSVSALSMLSALADNADVQALTSSQAAADAFEQAQQLADFAMLESLIPADLSDRGPPTPDKLAQFAGLLVGGTLPSGSQPQGAVSNDAELLPVSASMVEIVGVDASNTVNITLRGLRLRVKKPGRYFLQPVIAGITGELGSNILVEKYNPRTVEAVVIEYVVRILLLAVIGFLGLGNSAWHSPKITVPISTALVAGMVVYTYFTYIKDNVKAGSVNSIGLWWMICYGVIIFGTFWGLAGLHKSLGRMRVLRPFPVYRRQLYFAYCKRLVNEGHLSEISRLQRRVSNTEDPSVQVRERLYIQKRIEFLKHQQRAPKTQLKALIHSIFNDDPEAFYIPVRFYAAFGISCFVTSFLAASFFRAFSSLRASIRKSDVNTLVAIFRSLSVLQAQFVAQAGMDLPANAGGWVRLRL